MEYVKTKCKIPHSDNIESVIPIVWLEKQYLKTRSIKPKEGIYYLKYCECMEGMKCNILYISKHFYYWIKSNYKQYNKIL